MKNKKKAGAVVCLLGIFALGILARFEKNILPKCSKDPRTHAVSLTETKSHAAPLTDKDENYTKIIAAIEFPGVKEKELRLVEAEINKITRRERQIEVEFLRDTSVENINFMLAGGRQLDIITIFGNGLREKYLSQNILPLDKLLVDYGRGIIRETGKSSLETCKFNDHIYSIPNNRDYAVGTNAYMLRKDILDKYHIQAEDIQTQDDLEKVFEIVKHGEPGMTVVTSGTGSMLSNMYFSDVMTGIFRVGIHPDYGRSEEIVNLFESDEYMQALKRIRNWYLKGYIDQDPLGQTEDLFQRVRKGEIFSYITKWHPGLEAEDSEAAGHEMICVTLGETAVSFNSLPFYSYAVTSNTVSPEKSIQLLDLFFTSPEIMNLMCYGVEGIHYRKTDDGHITYVDENTNNPFLKEAWRKPNPFISHVWEGRPLTHWNDIREFNRSAIQCCDFGFNFDISRVATEYYNLEAIYAGYREPLENGLVNPDETLPMMLAEMKLNGIDDVIEEERLQFKKWKKNTQIH